MKIKILIPRSTKLYDYVVNFYSTYFYKFKKENPTDKTYTKTQMKKYISKVMSVRKQNVIVNNIKVPRINRWRENGWYEIQFWTWYYAVEVRIDKKKSIVLRIMEAVHNSDYHNDTMDTTPYDEQLLHNSTSSININEMMNLYYSILYNFFWGK